MDQATPYDFAAAGCSREAFDVKFSYFSAEEIKRVSAHQISSVDSFTDVGEILDGGLYSNRLGPLDMKKFAHKECPTCGLKKDCPGHLGHIELVCPVYNPLLFMDLFKLLRRSCMHCGRLKIKADKTERMVRALNGLLPHQLPESAVADYPLPFDKKLLTSDLKQEERCLLFEENASIGTSSKVWLENGEEQQSRSDEVWKKILERSDEEDAPANKSQGGQNGLDLVFKESSALESFRGLLQVYESEIPVGTCANCGMKAAKWRRDGFTKLFVKKSAADEDEFCLPIFIRKELRRLWEHEADILRWLIPGSVEHGSDIFFLESLLVPPNRFRNPIPSRGGGGLQLHAHTIKLKEILVFNERMRLALRGDSIAPTDDKVMKKTLRNSEDAPIQSPVMEFQGLQEAVNCFIDSTKSSQNQKLVTPGVRQLLEKKEGMFRMKMMGKRVNFAARSVISPDPNIETTEIGIPKLIADDLTYAEVANNTNAQWLSDLIIRGDKYPGAKEVHVPRPNGSKGILKLKSAPPTEREALAKQLVTDLESGAPPMTVMRHIRDGDPLLVNRQPTLHKPGIMAHLAKVMQNDERTIRLHYANCSTYNADFDGDEMNLHAPQDPLGRIEALSIARAEKQYLVPTSGKPLRGLIQDHVIGGVMLTRRDSYLTRNEVCNLIYIGLRAALEGGDLSSDKSREIEKLKMRLRRHPQKVRVHLDEPALLKPRKLWTGKQVLSILVKNIFMLCGKKNTKDSEGMTFSGKSKTAGDIWNGRLDGDKEEGTVLFQGTELLMGVLDKNQFGSTSFGIIHLIYEILGAKAVGMVLAAFARVFSSYLQIRGFTCQFADLILTEPTEDERDKLVANSRRVAQETIRDWLNKFDIAVPHGEKSTSQELSKAGRGLIEANRSSADTLEASMLGRMRQSWTNTIDACVPKGMVLPVPLNCMASMVQTGAKGSKVNQSMISCLLGQQELEGRQVPLMPTRRSLPSFSPYDLSSRTRGYITDRFLTGIRPQEFFFHCMAGREGLVDTAVKTSRSGYLQRCLVKHLESLKVCYDMTVRDGDGTVVQFLYGDDGVDVTLSSHLFKFDILFDNFKTVQADSQKEFEKLKASSKDATIKQKVTELEAAPAFYEAVKAAQEGHLSSSCKKLSALEAKADELQLDDIAVRSLKGVCDKLKEAKQRIKEGVTSPFPNGQIDQLFDPVSSVLAPAHFFGSTSDKHESELQQFVKDLVTKGKCSEKEAMDFVQFMHQKFLKSLAQPGEAVGVIAAQSMGEPSTQMTLNTFHLAGHGGANVTLGIPRLREIVQTASKTPSTPLMKVEVLASDTGQTDLLSRKKMANKLAARFRRVSLLDVVRKVGIEEKVRLHKGELIRSYFCRFEFWPIEELEIAIPHINRDVLKRYMTSVFVRMLKAQVQKVIAQVSQAVPKKQKAKRASEEGEEAAEGDDGENDPNPVVKKKRKVMGRGQRDGADMEEEVENEEKADKAEEGKANEDDFSEGSGMYSDVSSMEGDKDDEEKAAEEKAADEDVEEQNANKEGEEDAVEQDDEKDAAPNPQEAVKIKGKKAKNSQAAQATTAKDPDSQVDTALESGSLVWSGDFDKTDSIDIVVSYPLSTCPQKLLVSEIVRYLAAEKCTFEDKNALGVKKVHVEEDKGKVFLQCEGVNLQALQLLPKGTVDVKKITTNDINAVLETYGVEAARANIVKEIRGVFGHYGIEVNHRHLSLIGDFMTRAGGFRPFNRRGMTHCTSPFLAMSYETTMQFCQAACQDRVSDTMSSPAANIVLGNPVPLGTGMVNLLVDLQDTGPQRKKTKTTFDFSTPLISAPLAM